MTHGSLFSGIGGFDLAAEWMGWQNIFHCEWNDFSQKVLKHYWPDATSYTDITKTDFSIHRGNIDILTGGFPCQPFSLSGNKKGKADNRYLWPEMLRAIREIQPCWIVGENVPGIINWSRGMVVKEIKTNLENEGFTLLPPVIIPACAVNANHRRDRIWFIAYSESINGQKKNEQEKSFVRRPQTQFRGFYRPQTWSKRNNRSLIETSIFSRYDGLPIELDGIAVSKWADESVKAYGNAIVPQVAYQIFKAIEQYEHDSKD